METDQLNSLFDLSIPEGFLTMTNSWRALTRLLADSDYRLYTGQMSSIPAYTLWYKNRPRLEKFSILEDAYRSDFDNLQLHVAQISGEVLENSRFKWDIGTMPPKAEALACGYCSRLEEAKVCAQIARQILTQIVTTIAEIELSRSNFCFDW